ncbi:capsule biosynthesis GfcC family protein, partial [Pseudoalteromonas sp. SIMBA_153]
MRIRQNQQQTADWAYYKQNDAELLPGDILWLGFEPNQLPPKFKNLNSDIRDLLTHFVANESERNSLNLPVHEVENNHATSSWHW